MSRRAAASCWLNRSMARTFARRRTDRTTGEQQPLDERRRCQAYSKAIRCRRRERVERVGAGGDAASARADVVLDDRVGGSAAMTSMSTVSVRPAALTLTRALDPTPRAGPEYSQSRSMWSVNGSWLAITSRKSKTSSRGWGTSMVTCTGSCTRWYSIAHGCQGPRRAPPGRARSTTSRSNGIGDVSLRRLAAALGTSHRMLIHHFGSKDGCGWRSCRRSSSASASCSAELLPDPAQPAGEAMRAWWKHISDPALWPNERLFFELYGQALQGRRTRASCSTGSSTTGWTRSPRSTSPAASRRRSRAPTRGSVSRSSAVCCSICWRPATSTRVDAAMDAFIDVYEAWLERAAAA